MFTLILGFFRRLFVSELWSHAKGPDGQTDGRARHVMWPVRSVAQQAANSKS